LHNDNNSRIKLSLADEEATITFSHRLAEQLEPGMVIYLYGNLGAGKTTLVRGILKALGYTGRVKSPTYTLVEPYRIDGLDLLHFDLYRLRDESEWDSAGFRDDYDGKNIFLIEWPENATGSIPGPDVTITLDILPKGRTLVALANTETGKRCLEHL